MVRAAIRHRHHELKLVIVLRLLKSKVNFGTNDSASRFTMTLTSAAASTNNSLAKDLLLLGSEQCNAASK